MTIKIFSLQICINAHSKIRSETESLLIGSLVRLFSNTKKEHWKISIPRLARIKEYDSYAVQREEDFSPRVLPENPYIIPNGGSSEGIRRGKAHK